jgi:hypothetical protein
MNTQTQGPKENPAPKEERRVFCMRTGRSLPVSNHLECPYCRGNKRQVLTEIHQTFCDFKPGRDPVSFGFPDDYGRHLEG